MLEIIDDCRRMLGPAPRRISIFEWPHWQIFRSEWMTGNDVYMGIYAAQKLLRTEGRVVWGSVVQANNAIYRPGFEDMPGNCLWSPDSWYDDNLDSLRELSHYLFDHKGKKVLDPEVQRFTDNLANERTAWIKERLPDSITGGREVFYTTFMLHRKHVPSRRLSQGFFPMLISPLKTPSAIILPDVFWPDDLKEAWTSRSLKALRPSARLRPPDGEDEDDEDNSETDEA